MVSQLQLSKPASADESGNYNSLFDFESRQRFYRAGEQLFAEGDSALFVYRIVRGVVRSSRSLADGRRFVDSFRAAGDLVGFDIEGVREFSAGAITDIFVRIARVDTIYARSAVDRDAAKELLAATSLEVQRVRRHAMLLAMKAHQRIASFLLEMSEQLGQREILELPMSRQDIADYLGLSIETVCRVLIELDSRYLIGSRASRHIALLDPPALRRLADQGTSRQSQAYALMLTTSPFNCPTIQPEQSGEWHNTSPREVELQNMIRCSFPNSAGRSFRSNRGFEAQAELAIADGAPRAFRKVAG